jgi:hypothetical protein
MTTYLECFNKDYREGRSKEVEILETLRRFFKDDTIRPTRNRFDVFDYVGDFKFIELKTRRNKMNAYPTTMVGANKLKVAATAVDDIYFCFQFTDGLYYWKYNENDDVVVANGGRCDRGFEEIKPYAFIPIEKLIKIV